MKEVVIQSILQMRKLRLREINQREEGRKKGKKEGIEGGVVLKILSISYGITIP